LSVGIDITSHQRQCLILCMCIAEEAVRLKEKKFVSEIVAVSIGPKQSQEVLRTALAMGADRALHVVTDIRTDQALLPLAVAKILAKLADVID